MLQDASRVRFWWGISFLCNMVAVWFIQPLLALLYKAGTLTSVPAAIIELEAALPIVDSATTMGEILCLIGLLAGIAAASKAAGKAG